MANAESSFSGPIIGIFWIMIAGSVVVAGIVFGLGIYFVYKYRETNDVERNRVKNEGNFEKLWIGFAIILIVIVVVISTPTLYAIYEPSNTNNAVVIDVTGHQWYWSAVIPSQNISNYCGSYFPNQTSCTLALNSTGQVPPTESITQKVGQLYEFNITSSDVNHAVFVYDLAIKVDAIPGQFNTRFFTITQTGTYVVTCAEYCGTAHYDMQFLINAV